MTFNDAMVLLLVVLILIALAQYARKSKFPHSWQSDEELWRQQWELERQRQELEEHRRQLQDIMDKYQQRRSSPEFTLLRPIMQDYEHTLLRGSEDNAQESLLRAVDPQDVQNDLSGKETD